MLPLDPASHVVTAVVVTHNGARWLPECLEAVRGQTRGVQRVVGVDCGSRDKSDRILAEYLAPDAILRLPGDTGYGDAVRAALDHPRSRAEFAPETPVTEWVWLVHDDCVPEPDALKKLLAAADENIKAAVLGPKLRDYFDRRLLIEAGVTIDGAGRRETGLEPREFDQGQHDGTRQVLAVSSAGMLVRRDVWEQLGGFDPGLPLFRDDIDFCWRAGGAGHRVLVVTDAIAYHAEAAARRRRRISATPDHPRRVDRRNAMYVLLANLPFGAMLVALVRNSLASLLRVLLYLVAKQPANALDEAAAITGVYTSPLRLIRARYRRRRDRRRTYSAIQPFLAHGLAMRQLTEVAAGLFAGSPALDTAGRHQAVTAGPRGDDEGDDPLRDEHSVFRRALTHPGALLVLGLTLVSLVAERSLVLGDGLAGGALPPVWGGGGGPGGGDNPRGRPLAPRGPGGARGLPVVGGGAAPPGGLGDGLAGGALPPVWGSAGDLWALYTAGWHDVGIGSSAAAPPYVGLLAVLSTVLLGKPWLAVTLILLGCVPLAGLTAYLLARKVVAYPPAQVWMAGSYALLPMATGAVAQGRLGTALVHALLPVLGLLGTRMLLMPPRQSRRAAYGLALLLAACTAFVPLVWALSVVCGLLVAVAFGHVGRALYTSLAIALVGPLVLLLPWSLELVLHPSLWLLEAGLHSPALSRPVPSAEALLLLSPGGPGLPPIWVTGGFLAAALCALLLRHRRMLVAVGWSIALFGILIAILISRVAVAPPYGGSAATAWPGVALAFAATALLLSAATAARSFDVMLKMRGARRAFALGVAALALITPFAAAGDWMWNGVQGPLAGSGTPVMPSFLKAVGADGTQPRTLVLSPAEDGAMDYSVLRGREPRIGESQIPAADTPRAALDTVVAHLAAGRGGDEAAALAGFGIGYVLVPHPPGVDDAAGDPAGRGDAGTTLVDTIDAVPGARRLTLTPEYALWRLDRETGRLRIAGEDGTTVLKSGPGDIDIELEPGTGKRTLLLAEPADSGWSASLSGYDLEPVPTRNGMQAFDLPPSGGRLLVAGGVPMRDVWLVAQAVLALVILVLALPGVRTEEDVRRIEEQPRVRPRLPERARRAAAPAARAARAAAREPDPPRTPDPAGDAPRPPAPERPAPKGRGRGHRGRRAKGRGNPR